MTVDAPRTVVAVDGTRGRELADELRRAAADVRIVVPADAPAGAAVDAMSGPEAAELLGELARADLLVVTVGRTSLTAQLVSACDRFGVRIVGLCDGPAEGRLAEVFGITTCASASSAAELLAPVEARHGRGAGDSAARGRMIAVWGPAGAPGRTTTAIELACELARDGRRVGLVDADSHAPSVALATGLADEGPGFAAACRQAERGTLTASELTRIAVPLGAVDVLTGINRPNRWPELSHDRVAATLGHCRTWVDDTVVDTAAPLERDEEIVSDLDGPRRNAATLATLATADVVVAVVAADPVGVSRFVRAYADLRAAAGAAPVHVLVNKLRSSTLGMDARGQVRRTIERYTGASDLWFAPWDPKAADAATLSAQPIALVAGRSPLAGAVRRFVGEAIEPPVPVREERAARRAQRIAAPRTSGRRARTA